VHARLLQLHLLTSSFLRRVSSGSTTAIACAAHGHVDTLRDANCFPDGHANSRAISHTVYSSNCYFPRGNTNE
jgi:hypothetical protein